MHYVLHYDYVVPVNTGGKVLTTLLRDPRSRLLYNEHTSMRPTQTYVQFVEQLVVFASEGDRLLQGRADLHQVGLHLLDAHTDPFVALKRNDNRTLSETIRGAHAKLKLNYHLD